MSSSCTSVYLDGSEVRGSTNATLVARYGNVESTSSLTVWVPEMPLDIQLDDVKLNQVSGWKVANTGNYGANGGSQCRLRYQQTAFEVRFILHYHSLDWLTTLIHYYYFFFFFKSLQVFARFYAEDHDSGRVSYLISRKTYLLITDLVRKVMRVADPRIASLKTANGYIEGLKPGKTEVQVLSPMSGHVIAAREIRVLADKVDVAGLSVRLIAGLSLSLSPDPDLDSCFVAQVEASDRLHSRYQEAILDMTVHFSDGTASPLRVTDRSHYNLLVESHNTTILALTSPARANIPRVLALGEGRATLSVTFSSACTTNQDDGNQVPAHPLATTTAVIQLALTGHPATSVQNDARTESSGGQAYTLPHNGVGGGGGGGGSVGGHGNQIIGEAKRNGGKMAAGNGRASAAQPNNQGQLTFSKPGSTEFGVNENQLSLKDDSNAVMMSSAGRDLHGHPAYPAHYPGISSSSWHMGPLEIGMYVLLAIFCAAIVVFVGTCIVYASRARKGLIPVDDDHLQIDRTPHPPPPPPPSAPIDGGRAWPSLWNRLRKMNQKDDGGDGDEEDGRGIGEENEDEGEDKGWIWLGRSTLDPEVPRRQTPVERPVSAAAPDPNNKQTNRLSGISYAGSEVSVRIVGRPGQDGGRLSYKAQLCFEPLKDSVDQSDGPETTVAATNSWPGSVDSNTFTKNSPIRITANQLDEDSLLLSDVVRRPNNNRRATRQSSEQDTRRYARSWLMAGEAVPRDFNSNPSMLMVEPEDDEEEEEQMEEAESTAKPDSSKLNLKLDLEDAEGCYNVATFLRHGSPDIKQANIIENPRFSACIDDDDNNTGESLASAAVETESAANQASAAVDYDRIISYLGILKETST